MEGPAPLPRFARPFGPFLLLAAILSAACSEQAARPAAQDTVLEPSLAPTPSQCDTRDLARDARAYLPRAERRVASTALSDMEDACANDDVEGVWSAGWIVLAQIESASSSGEGGDPAAGASLANGVTAFMCDADVTCTIPPATVQPGALSGAGIFAVRGEGSAPAVATTAVPFTDFDGVANGARWGLETSASNWSDAVGVPTTLFHGVPLTGDPLGLSDLAFGNFAFDMERFPDAGGFPTNLVHIGVCYDTEVTLPHIDEDESEPTLVGRMQREGTILEPHNLSCSSWPAAASNASPVVVFASVASAVGSIFLPRPLAAALMTDRKAPSTGGSPIDFSEFAAVAADPQGRVEWVMAPQNGDDDQPLADIVVRAVTGEGTPIERVEVTLELVGNEGVPAGASFCPAGAPSCPLPTALTLETLSGFDPVATFTGVQVWKPGRYTICAQGSLNGFSFEETCEVLFIKN